MPPFKGAVLRRLDLKADWSPENMKWATSKEDWDRKKTQPIGWQNWLPDDVASEIMKQCQDEALWTAKRF